MSNRVDLHCHTLCSDGSDSPRELVMQAKELGLCAVAITDHDTDFGHAEALAAGAEFGMEVVPGVELSSLYEGEHIHLLAYWAGTDHPVLGGLMLRAVYERERRNEKMVRLLQEAGYPIDVESLYRDYPGQTMLGRPHIAEYLMKKGLVRSIREGVVELMGRGKPFYVPRYHIPFLQYVRAVREAGGVPVIAHLYQYHFSGEQLREMVRVAVSEGLMGLEAMYPTYTPEQQENVFRLAKEFHLVCTGGSDYHGKRKPPIALGTGTGNLAVPYEMLEDLKAARERA